MIRLIDVRELPHKTYNEARVNWLEEEAMVFIFYFIFALKGGDE